MARITYVTTYLALAATLVLLFLFARLPSPVTATDCDTVTALVSACSTFLNYGSPDPMPGTPCCVAMTSLNNLADTGDNRRDVCRCMMDLIGNYNPNATAIATVPGFCGVSLGFTIDPNTDCEYIDQYAKVGRKVINQRLAKTIP